MKTICVPVPGPCTFILVSNEPFFLIFLIHQAYATEFNFNKNDIYRLDRQSVSWRNWWNSRATFRDLVLHRNEEFLHVSIQIRIFFYLNSFKFIGHSHSKSRISWPVYLIGDLICLLFSIHRVKKKNRKNLGSLSSIIRLESQGV